MSDGLGDVRRMHRAPRRALSLGARATRVYVASLVAAMLVAPVARGLWLVADDAELADAVASHVSPGTLAAAVAIVAAAAVLVGGVRGPIVPPPILAFVLGTGPLVASVAHRRRALASFAAGAVLGACIAAAVAVVHGPAAAGSGWAWAIVILSGAACGIVVAGMWLLGQVIGARTRMAVAAVLAASATVAALVPAAAVAAHAGWAASVVAMVAVVAVLSVPTLLERLDPRVVQVQAERWDAASGHASMLDLDGVGAIYGARPSSGHGLPAVRPVGGMLAVLVVRDAIAALRTPRRLALGVAALLVAGGLLAAALASPQAWALAIPAALLGGVASSVLAAGLLHALEVARSTVLYGLPDLELVVNHAVLPLVATTILLLVGGLAIAALTGSPPLPVMLASVVLACGTVLGRITGRLRAAPSALLHLPVVTPIGDLGAMLRAAASLESVLVLVAVGVAAVTAATAPIVSAVVAIGLGAVLTMRWRQRRA